MSIPTLPQSIQYEHKWIILHKELWAKFVFKDETLIIMCQVLTKVFNLNLTIIQVPAKTNLDRADI